MTVRNSTMAQVERNRAFVFSPDLDQVLALLVRQDTSEALFLKPMIVAAIEMLIDQAADPLTIALDIVVAVVVVVVLTVRTMNPDMFHYKWIVELLGSAARSTQLTVVFSYVPQLIPLLSLRRRPSWIRSVADHLMSQSVRTGLLVIRSGFFL